NRNPTAARENLLDPATQGNQHAQYTLGIMLQAGASGPKRETAPRRRLDRAAGGPDQEIATRAATLRDKLDAQPFSSDDSTGKALTALAFIVLIAVATDGSNSSSGGGGGSLASSPTQPFAGGSSSSSSMPVRPIPHYPGNITKAVNGDITNPKLVW